jgi:hypothetical protein
VTCGTLAVLGGGLTAEGGLVACAFTASVFGVAPIEGGATPTAGLAGAVVGTEGALFGSVDG